MTATITKKELIDRIAASTGQRRSDVKRIMHLFFEQMMVELGRGNRLEFRDFGVFETKQRAARTAQNPRTMQRVTVPAKRTVKFKIGRMMKQVLDDPEAFTAQMAALALTLDSEQEDSSPRRNGNGRHNGRHG